MEGHLRRLLAGALKIAYSFASILYFKPHQPWASQRQILLNNFLKVWRPPLKLSALRQRNNKQSRKRHDI